jgi:hypothetical protein
MAVLAVILLVALLIPIAAIVFDSPLGRALARRVEGPAPEVPPSLVDLARKVDLLESEVDDLGRLVQNLQDENAFLQRLIEDAPPRAQLPPPGT